MRFFFGLVLIAVLASGCFGKDSTAVKPPIKPPAPVVAAHAMVNDTTIDQFPLPQGALIVSHDSMAHVTYIDTINNVRIDDYFQNKNKNTESVVDGKHYSVFKAVKKFINWELVK
jgi:hypothetical protein